MKSIFDNKTRVEIIDRIKLLNENSQAKWGKMNVCQMLKHCILSEEHNFGKLKYKQVFLGRLFGKFALKSLLKDEKPLRRNLSTGTDFKNLPKDCDINSEKIKWISLIEDYSTYSNNEFVHIFFGKMKPEQVGLYTYKHADHHLRQFGV